MDWLGKFRTTDEACGVKLIAGLGNPGPQYRETRHNVGFQVLDALAERLKAAFNQEKYGGLIAKASFEGQSLLLVKPMTFMNRSGECVARALRYSGAAVEDMLVVVDDVDLPVGKLRLRANGSAGGHNGLKSIIQHLGTDEFARLRAGVGRNESQADLAGHVLSRFRGEDAADVKAMVARAVDAVLRFVADDIARAMNEFN